MALSDDEKRKVIRIIRSYPTMAQDIHDRREKIKHPYQESVDENIGGGRAENVRNESTERMISKLVDGDHILNKITFQAKAVEKVLKQCIKKQNRSLLDNITYDIIFEFYLTDIRTCNADSIARKVNISRSQVYERRNAFIEAVYYELTKDIEKDEIKPDKNRTK